MKGNDKTKEQLIGKLAEMSHLIAELEASKIELEQAEEVAP